MSFIKQKISPNYAGRIITLLNRWRKFVSFSFDIPLEIAIKDSCAASSMSSARQCLVGILAMFLFPTGLVDQNGFVFHTQDFLISNVTNGTRAFGRIFTLRLAARALTCGSS